jgi:hypothetical protein
MVVVVVGWASVHHSALQQFHAMMLATFGCSQPDRTWRNEKIEWRAEPRPTGNIKFRDDSAMAMFVHLTTEENSDAIRRSGIRRQATGLETPPRGCYAMPVVRNFFVSHQWLRELKRGRAGGPFVGVHFRIPDDQEVWVGHYGRNHGAMSASEAIATFDEAEDRMGWEVIIPRRIEASEIHRIRHLPQVLGWRYFPGSNGKPPACTCKYCIGGTYGSNRFRAKFEQKREFDSNRS